MILPQRTADFGNLNEDNNQEIELDEYQVNVLKILSIDNVNMEDVDRDELYNQQQNYHQFPP